MTVSALLEKIFAGSEQINIEEMHRRAVLADLPPELIAAIGHLPEGLYDRSATESLLDHDGGVDPGVLSEEDLVREMESLGHTRAETVRHGSWSALARHTTRTHELENEYLRRHPEREIDPQRTRDGARALRD
ncbi:MAG TPA: DUF6158 family protein [Candidatus Limnocylindrales bacterium]